MTEVGEIDARSVYVETLRPPYTSVRAIRELFEPCGPVEYVAIQRDPRGHFLGFAFIRFSHVAGAHEAVRRLNCHPDPHDTITLPPMGSDLAPNARRLGLRVITKRRWCELRDEYKANIKTCQSRVDDQLRRSAKPITFTEGTIVRYHGADPACTKTDLAALFGAFGDVQYVDNSHGRLAGYVRYAQPNDAARCVAYFAQHPRMVHTARLAGDLAPEGEVHGPVNGQPAQTTEVPPEESVEAGRAFIRTKVLQGKEEINYWHGVRQLWQNQARQTDGTSDGVGSQQGDSEADLQSSGPTATAAVNRQHTRFEEPED